METRAFQPLYRPSASTPATATTAAVTTPGTLNPSTTITASVAAATNTVPFAGMTNNQIVQIQIANKTSAWAHVNFGVLGAVVAATVAAGYPVAPGGVVVVTVANEVTAASVILDAAPSGSASVVFTRGEGL
jgi:hypothetical protein